MARMNCNIFLHQKDRYSPAQAGNDGLSLFERVVFNQLIYSGVKYYCSMICTLYIIYAFAAKAFPAASHAA